MADWRPPLAPGEAAIYDPALHGPGKDGIRAWRDAALAFLAANGGHPLGNELDIRRLAVAERLRLFDDQDPDADAT